MTAHTLQRPEGERLWLHYPAATSTAGTILFLAGTGGTAEWAAEESNLPLIAPQQGFHLIVPEAQRPNPAEPARFISNPPRWNDGSPPPTPELQTDVDDVAFLSLLLDELIGRGIADPQRIYLTGFSNGAGMVFRYAVACADRLAAIAPIAGLWWPLGQQPSRPVPTFYLLGSVDPLIPYRGGEVHIPWGNRIVRRPPAVQTLEAWATAIGCDPRSVIEKDTDGVREEVYPGAVECRAIFVEGLGHHWPGGRGQLNRRIAGPTCDRLDLNPPLLAFFRRHTR